MAPTALFVIDIQAELAQDPTTEIPHAARVRDAGAVILERARKAIDEARGRGQDPDLSIVIVQHEEDAAEGTLVRGSKAWELVFPPRDDDASESVVSKRVRDTFESNPALAAQLKNQGVQRIVAFGIQSECCVLSTCRGALDSDFRVTLLQGAHSTYNVAERPAEQIESEVEKELVQRGAIVTKWEEWQP